MEPSFLADAGQLLQGSNAAVELDVLDVLEEVHLWVVMCEDSHVSEPLVRREGANQLG